MKLTALLVLAALFLSNYATAAENGAAPVAASQISSTAIACVIEESDPISGALVFVNDKFEAIRLDHSAPFLVYSDDAQGMKMVDPMEFDMEMHPLEDYSVVATLDAGEVAHARTRNAFSMVVTPKGQGNEIHIKCALTQP